MTRDTSDRKWSVVSRIEKNLFLDNTCKIVKMDFTAFVPTTTGEHLFQVFIRDFFGSSTFSQLQASPLLRIGGRTDEMTEYFIGLSALNLVARILKKAQRVRSDEKEEYHQTTVVAYIQRSLGIPLVSGSDSVDRLASLALKAAADSKKAINDAVKSIVLNGRKETSCYICGTLLLKKNDSLPENRIEYEHLWPSSFGGNSVAENLLPACGYCNRAKGHMMLWQSSHISSFVLKPSPSEEEWKMIQRSEKIAKYAQTIFRSACHNKTSLKDAALFIGPVSLSSIYAADEDDAIDFFNFEFR